MILSLNLSKSTFRRFYSSTGRIIETIVYFENTVL